MYLIYTCQIQATELVLAATQLGRLEPETWGTLP